MNFTILHWILSVGYSLFVARYWMLVIQSIMKTPCVKKPKSSSPNLGEVTSRARWEGYLPFFIVYSLLNILPLKAKKKGCYLGNNLFDFENNSFYIINIISAYDGRGHSSFGQICSKRSTVSRRSFIAAIASSGLQRLVLSSAFVFLIRFSNSLATS